MKVIIINNPEILSSIKNNVEQLLLDIEEGKVARLKHAQDDWNNLSRFGQWWDENFTATFKSKKYKLILTQKSNDMWCLGQKLICLDFLKKLNSGKTSFQFSESDCEKLSIMDLWEKYPAKTVKRDH